jgi:hypothetical protein
MSTVTLVEQTTPSVPSAGQQVFYPKAGSLARLDSTGIEKTLLDSRTYAAAEAARSTQIVFGGI